MEAVNIDQVLAPSGQTSGMDRPAPATAPHRRRGSPCWRTSSGALDGYLARPLARYTARTVTNPELLRRELEGIRAGDSAIGQEEYEAGSERRVGSA